MKIWTEENPKDLTTTVYVAFKRVIRKVVYDTEGHKKEDTIFFCHCPLCKHFAFCSGSKVWYAKQMGGCDDFETE